MGGKIFAHPFRIGPNGSVLLVDEASEQGASQLIAAAVLTQKGEIPMYPTFGITNPLFRAIELAEVAAVIEAFGPKVKVLSAKSEFEDGSTQNVSISFTQDPQEVALSGQS